MSVRRKRIGLKGKLLLAFMPMATVPLVVMQRNAAYLAPDRQPPQKGLKPCR